MRVVDSSSGTVVADHSYFLCGTVRRLAHDNTQSGSPVSTQYFPQGVIAGGTPYYYVQDEPERKAVIEAHMTLGLHIRNAWFRSARTALNGYLREKGARSLDDASSLLLTAYWRHLNGVPADLD